MGAIDHFAYATEKFAYTSVSRTLLSCLSRTLRVFRAVEAFAYATEVSRTLLVFRVRY